jgi:hypothetical protein
MIKARSKWRNKDMASLDKTSERFFPGGDSRGAETFSAFGAEQAVVRNVRSAISTKHFKPNLAAGKKSGPSPRENQAPA